MNTVDFDYELPQELIAQKPLTPRDASRLLVLNRQDGVMQHKLFPDLFGFLQSGDVLVLNNSRVLPARLYGQKPTGGRVELLLLEQHSATKWQALVGGKRLRTGSKIHILDHDGRPTAITATITAVKTESLRELSFNQPIAAQLSEFGLPPLPPYIHEPLADPERYQTIYARPLGSAAAPTAGLHFTPELLLALRERGVNIEYVTLHVGLDTFKPVTADAVANHTIHSEWAQLTPETARRINEAKLSGGRLVAVGTTAVRTLETAALRSAGIEGSLQSISQRDASGETFDICPWRPVAAFNGATDLFIYPGYRYRVIDSLLTNFHLPRSSLLMLIAAFAGLETIKHTYHTAVAEKYRFYSFGDAMLIH